MFIACKAIDYNLEKIDLIRALMPAFTYFEDNFLFFSSMLTNQRTSVFRERMLQNVAASITEKINMQEINQEMDKELITQFMASAFVGTVEWWILNSMPRSPQFMAEQLWKLFQRNDIYPR